MHTPQPCYGGPVLGTGEYAGLDTRDEQPKLRAWGFALGVITATPFIHMFPCQGGCGMAMPVMHGRQFVYVLHS